MRQDAPSAFKSRSAQMDVIYQLSVHCPHMLAGVIPLMQDAIAVWLCAARAARG